MQGDQSILQINDKSELDQNDDLIITSQDMINMENDENEELAEELDQTTFKHLYDKFDLSQENV